jgi:hypothetical protein
MAASLGRQPAADVLARAREAAAWLTSVAEEHETVIAVTHVNFRKLLALALRAQGWHAGPPPRMRHWGVWEFGRRRRGS